MLIKASEGGYESVVTSVPDQFLLRHVDRVQQSEATLDLMQQIMTELL